MSAMTAVDIAPLQQSVGVALVFWGVVIAVFLALLGLYVWLAVRKRRSRRRSN
jgi:heme/copper-type cytochrome/quinol oxidase subunit 2